MRAKRISTTAGELHGYMIRCPACDWPHVLNTGWTFNGNFELPTFTPSVLVTKPNTPERCHSFITDGKIKYLSDCTHAMAGQTVDLPDVTSWGEEKP